MEPVYSEEDRSHMTVLAVSTAGADTIFIDAANCPGPGIEFVT